MVSSIFSFSWPPSMFHIFIWENVYDRLSCVLNEKRNLPFIWVQGNRRESSQIINDDIYLLLYLIFMLLYIVYAHSRQHHHAVDIFTSSYTIGSGLLSACKFHICTRTQNKMLRNRHPDNLTTNYCIFMDLPTKRYYPEHHPYTSSSISLL